MKRFLLSILLTTISFGQGQVFPPAGGGAPSGSAGGDLSGTYPNPTVAKVNGVTPASTNTASAVVVRDGSGNFAAGTITATSINKVAITAPATGATLTIVDGKTLTASNTLTFTGTDGSSLAIGAGGTAVTGTPTSGNIPQAGSGSTLTNSVISQASSNLTLAVASSILIPGSSFAKLELVAGSGSGSADLYLSKNNSSDSSRLVLSQGGNFEWTVGSVSDNVFTVADLVNSKSPLTISQSDDIVRLLALGTATNCSDSAGGAACGSAAAGSFVMDAAATTVVVSTTAVTANSQIFVFFDSSLGTRLSVTCNTTVPALYGVSARTAGTSFTLTATASTTNPACWSYLIVN